MKNKIFIDRKARRHLAEAEMDAQLTALVTERLRRGGKSIPNDVFWTKVQTPR